MLFESLMQHMEKIYRSNFDFSPIFLANMLYRPESAYNLHCFLRRISPSSPKVQNYIQARTIIATHDEEM